MGKMSVSIYMKGYYEVFYGFVPRENKPNSKPNKANLTEPRGVEQRSEAGGQMSIIFRKKEEM